MPRRPKENYYQVNGRPHAGLSNPKKFGLTFNQVVDLIDRGEWIRFYSRWLYAELKRKRVERLGYVCPKCQKIVLDVSDWREPPVCCRKCKIDRVYCSNCRKENRIVFKTGSFKLCRTCQKLLHDLRELTSQELTNEG